MIAAAAFLAFAAGCAHAPAKPGAGNAYTPSIGEKALATALKMEGRPYKFRGEAPGGFDCSGLVRYSYLTAGMDVPHGTGAQLKVSHSVGLSKARKGDLVFFEQEGKKFSHVGLFVGRNEFIHAPSTGGKVRKDSLDDPYWKKHYLDTRRFN